MKRDETICAISTPPGEAGIGIVRISGESSYPILKAIFRPKRRVRHFKSHRFYLGNIVDPTTKKIIDEVLVVYMRAPKTYTREDIVEIHSHGGYFIQQKILSLIIDQGARLAEPGEFTKRAFLNGRIDLLQAESVLALIQSESEKELECALAQLDGKLSKKISQIKDLIKNALALVEAKIDFPEEDVDVNPKEIIGILKEADRNISYLLDSYSAGRMIKEGHLVLIVGRTNVGKSSLLNEIVLKERAIVTPLPGTTRDLIEDVIRVNGIKVRIVDTAGIRDPRDVVEKEGIERVRKKIPEADLILWVIDGSQRITEEDLRIYGEIKDREVIGVVNKIDLEQRIDLNFFKEKDIPFVKTCALTGEGVEELKNLIYDRLHSKSPKKGRLVITSLRHKNALEKARECIKKALTGIEDGVPEEFTAFELREALNTIGEILGEVFNDEILEEIFSRFCIGK